MKPATLDAYKLMHRGALTLADMEANGQRIDTAYLDKAIRITSKKIKEIKESIRNDEVFLTWRKRYGKELSLESNVQLGTVLSKDFGIALPLTAKGQIKTDKYTLGKIELPFLRMLVQARELGKARGTYLEGLRRELVGEYVHPIFNLHIAITYRSSCELPNFQNIPVRDPFLGRLIRRCFIARDGHVLCEIDFKGVEVSVAACYNHDPVLIKYVKDKTKDMHRDMAMQIFMLKLEELDAEGRIRQEAKGGFVFPAFYGDYYVNTAEAMWEGSEALATADGVPLHKHLRRKGISTRGACDPERRAVPGTFEHHVKEVEYDFWNRRFKVYKQWKDETWERYQQRGYMRTKTGFRVSGFYTKNQIINNGIQGSAFHCDLWVMSEMNTWLEKKRMKSRLVNTIHDSVIGDVYEPELPDYLGRVKELVREELPKKWPWIIVPLDVEAKVAPSGGSWFDCKKVAI